MVGYVLAVAWSLWLGILTSIHPCPLAANIVAVSYIARRLGQPRQVLLAGLAYTMGRAAAYMAIGTALVGGLLSSPAVAAFLERRIGFDDIPRIIEQVMTATPAAHLESIHEVLVLDTEARLLASEMVEQRRQKGSPIRAIS